jgi:hypothetical protein
VIFVRSLIKDGIFVAFNLFVICLSSNPALAAKTATELLSPEDMEKLYAKANAEKLYTDSVWVALIHSNNENPEITDKSFLLSHSNFSLSEEMKKTLEFLYQGNPANVCRFPARYFWLQQQLSLPKLPLESCPDLIEFKRKVPMEHIALVYASETASQPAGILGHSFLKLSGVNDQGREVSHAISFYTDTDTINFPKLFFDSLTGMNGYFSLTPYSDLENFYVNVEQRNLWEYQLRLNDNQRELIRLHLLELKQTKLIYFFQKYNCATVLNFILALSGKPIETEFFGVTPRDLIKHAQQANLIEHTTAITSDRWLFIMLSNEITNEQKDDVVAHVIQGDLITYFAPYNSHENHLKFELASVYNDYAHSEKKLNQERWMENKGILNKIETTQFPDLSMTTDNRFNPVNTPPESQLSIGNQHDQYGNSLVINLSPISHTLSDDNRSYSNETSLQFFSASLEHYVQSQRTILDSFTIFGMESLLPYDEYTGGISSMVHIGIEPQRNSQLNIIHVFSTNGEIGLTERIFPDMDMYIMAGGGLGYTVDGGEIGYTISSKNLGSIGSGVSPYTTAEMGTIIREFWDMKTWINIRRTDNQIQMGSYYYTIKLDHSIFIDPNNTINIDLQRDLTEGLQVNTVFLALKRLF